MIPNNWEERKLTQLIKKINTGNTASLLILLVLFKRIHFTGAWWYTSLILAPARLRKGNGCDSRPV